MALVNIVPALYTSDYGVDFQVGVDAALLAQESATDVAKIGGDSAPTIPAGTPPLPASVKPRRAYMKDPATGYARTVIVLTPDAALATNGATTIQREDSNNVAHTLQRVKMLSEDFGRTFSAA